MVSRSWLYAASLPPGEGLINAAVVVVDSSVCVTMALLCMPAAAGTLLDRHCSSATATASAIYIYGSVRAAERSA